MPRGNLQQASISNFAGGMNTKFSDFNLRPDEYKTATNAALSLTGSVQKRFGYTQVGATQADFSGGVKDISAFIGSDATTLPVANGGTKIKFFNATVWADLPSLPTISNGDERFGYMMYQDKLLMGSQSHYFEWDGSGAVVDNAAAISTNGDILMLDGELRRVYMSGDDGNASTVYITSVDSFTDFTGGSSVKVYENDGSNIVGMAMVLESRYIMKTNKIVRLDYDVGTDIHTPVISDPIYGPSGKDAWTLGESNVFFFTGTEIRGFGKFANFVTERSVNFSTNVDASILSDMDVDFLSDVALDYSKAEKRLILSYASINSTGGVKDKQIPFNFNITREDGLFPCEGFWDLPLENAFEIGRDFYFVEPATGKIHIFDDTFNDAGAAIDFSLTTRSETYGNEQEYVLLRWLRFSFKNVQGSLTVTAVTEDNSGILTDPVTFTIGQTSNSQTGWNLVSWNQNIWNIGTTTVETKAFERYEHDLGQQGQLTRLTFENDTVDENVVIVAVDYIYIPENFGVYSPDFVI